MYAKRNVTTNGVSAPDCSVDLDLTGSPLAFPFISCDYDVDDTFISEPIKNWQKDEESQGSLSVIKARKILSLCNLHTHHWKVPIWVVCDGSDYQQSILLSTFCDRKSGWVTRNSVKLLGHWSYTQAEEYAVNVRKEHLSISRIPGCEVKILTTQVYNILSSTGHFGKSAQCNISVHLSWSSSSLVASPPLYANAVVEMLIVVGQPTSAAYELWKQLKLLHQLVTVLAVSKEKQESGCIDLPGLEYGNGNSARTETTDVISLLHEMDYIGVKYQGTTFYGEKPATAMPLNQLVQQAVSSKSTLYLDFVHHLFLLLANCRDSVNLAKCLLLVFQEVQSGDAKLFVHPKNPTRIAHILRELMRGSLSLPEISGIRSVELLIEIGLEKISKDYTHIFLSSGVATLEQLKLPSCNINELNEVCKKLDVLGRLQVTLEILLLAESQMKFSVSSLQSLATFGLSNFQTQVESFSKLLEVDNIKFQAPVSMKELQCLITSKYSSSCMQLTSDGDKYKVRTVLHCSAFPIFPFVSPDSSDSQLCDESGILSKDLHCSQLTCLSNKLLSYQVTIKDEGRSQ
ncbi:protein zwilch homolog isoform X2 [Zootermopsis nevadensis]|uniref:protein zwilch homolog isoform X2 n=1 Tax=Zootermopsis nevadensis TaxID=136037 RepID=UPI000B8E3313|nr:protein zwilch homolog isoform X2 [Zootermopsis nevadensis]